MHPIRSTKRETLRPSRPEKMLLAGTLLNCEYESVHADVKKGLEQSNDFGVTIASDGWANTNWDSILNFMVSINGSAFFLKSLDCTIHLRDGGSNSRIRSRQRCPGYHGW
mmetsp:Transcript_60629/g.161888  ORF Transcript_60629/g.161888 Transcript_60629/m.161888 type:complete len:110 (-) Transcript_60629:534-863(-)